MWFGLAVGYMYHFGFFKRIEMGANRATILEGKFPFLRYKDKSFFVTAGASCGGQILPSFGQRAGGATASEANAAADPAATNSAAANFKAFSGKGTSIGGNPVRAAASASAPRVPHTGASASRGRSTPETRAAAASGANPGARTGSALIAKLEEKKRQESVTASDAGSTSALTTTDVGHEMDPDDNEIRRAKDDKDSAVYAKINLNDTENSV